MANKVKKAKFDTRNVGATASIAAEFKDSMQELYECLDRHFTNESDINEEDKRCNEEDIEAKRGRVVSMFNTTKGKIYIITQALEYMDNDPSDPMDRDYYNTMVMFASEY